ncbi:MAG: hypothetical protein ABSH06_14260 [Thermodesulfobacteriota bacterium]|jgi:hypothetical protein
MAYKSFLIEVPDVNDALAEVNDKGFEIVSAIYVSDSAQVLMIVKESEKKSFLKDLRKKVESKGEEEVGRGE